MFYYIISIFYLFFVCVCVCVCVFVGKILVHTPTVGGDNALYCWILPPKKTEEEEISVLFQNTRGTDRRLWDGNQDLT